MLTALYYLPMLLLGFAWYKFGQNLLLKGYRDAHDQRTEGLAGPVGFLVTAVIGCYLLFALLRALLRAEVPGIRSASNSLSNPHDANRVSDAVHF